MTLINLLGINTRASLTVAGGGGPQLPDGILDGIVATKFVSPTGSTGAGSLVDPWSLAHAITHVVPGDVVQLRGGDYRTTGSSYTFTIAGTLSAGLDSIGGKIIWMPYQAEKPRLVNANIAKAIEPVRIQAAYNWFVDIETFREHEDRYNYGAPGNGIWVQNSSSTGTKLLYTRVHEGGAGLYIEGDSGDCEVYGHIGWYAGVCEEPRVHGAYVHHNPTGTLKIYETILFSTLGLGIQGYTSGGVDGSLANMDVKGMVVFDAGNISNSGTSAGGPPQTTVLFGSDISGNPVTDCTFSEIIAYCPTGKGSSAFRFYNNNVNTITNTILQDSYLIGGSASSTGAFKIEQYTGTPSLTVQRNTFIQQNATQVLTTANTGVYTGITWDQNEHWGRASSTTSWRHGSTNKTWANWQSGTGLGGTDTQHDGLPTVNKVFVRPVNKYFKGRAHIIFFNWESLSRVPADLTGILSTGDSFVVKNVQDIFGSNISVYAAASGGSPITTLPSNKIIYLPTDGVTPPLPWGSNKEPMRSTSAMPSSLPTLPDPQWPQGGWTYPTNDNKAYKNVGDVWVNTTEWANPPENFAPFFSAFYIQKV